MLTLPQINLIDVFVFCLTLLNTMSIIPNHQTCHFWEFCTIFIALNLLSFLAIAIDTISSTQPILMNQTLVSPGGLFELGFFDPQNSRKLYVGIWYKDLPARTIVWVANRDNPLRSSSGVLKFAEDGNLVVLDEEEHVFWSTNQSRSQEKRVARLLDSGNFVVHQENADSDDPGNYLFQSFDFPTDTLLPGMKLGWDRKSGRNRFLTSWRKPDDPSSGDFTFKLEINGYPGAYLRNKEFIYYRSGPWNGLRFSGVPEMNPSPVITFLFKMNEDEVFYMYELHNESLYSRLLVNHTGSLQRFMWISTRRVWNLFWYAKKDQCDDFQECGPYGICDPNNSPICKCMKGFEPKNLQAWILRDGSDGCVRKSELDCENGGFLKLGNMKLPDSSNAFVDSRMSLEECGKMCRRNCSCNAYTNSNISEGGSGCVLWSSDLMDMRQYAASEGGQDLFVRAASSDLEQPGERNENHSERTKQIIFVTAIIAAAALVASGITTYILWRRKSHTASRAITQSKGLQERSRDFLLTGVIPSKRDYSMESPTEECDLPLFDFGTIADATDHFSDAKKLGQGGFGIVYKGVLPEGQEIAAKRLSKNSGQGVEEFKNELKLIAMVQHRNLVRLLGCCVDMEEKMLIYEYMEHGSLDSILFSKERSSLLNWRTRFNIILGIARGLVYLHQDSRFRIVHRDLKASNVLLNKDMEPKISDFGMARIFACDQTEVNTKRIVGTYGYMSPEYAMDGLFSIKSDVFSFGVLVLEIISGQKNRGFYKTNNQLNLLAYAWKLWRDGRGVELLDLAAGDSYSPFEINRCIQVGLLCVQEQAEDRPSMGSVVLMLSSDTISLSQPKTPGFCLGRRPTDSESSSSLITQSCTVNQVTVTMLDGR